jgi:flagellar secretion chaperone FliS
MNPYARPNAYRENSIMTASPEQLVVMLYDGAGRFLRQAEGSMIDGSWLQASEKLSRAEAIIDELLATLDMDAGEVADRLQSIYVFCKTRLIEARIERLEALAAEEAQLVADERFDDLAELNARRAALIAALPTPLPAAAAAPLRNALGTQRATATVLQARRDAIGTELGRLRQGRTGVQGYARTFEIQR